MKRTFLTLLLILGLLSPVYAQTTVTQGGTGINTVPNNYFLVGSSTLRLQAIATSTAASLVNYWTKLAANLYYTAGNIGIGTTSPQNRLEVVGINSQTARLTAPTAGAGTSLIFADGGTPTQYNWIAGANYNANDIFEITPSTAVGGTTFSTPILVAKQGGNVGIGTITPDAKLQINSTYGGAYASVLAFRQGANPTYGFTFKQDDVTTGDLQLDRLVSGVSTAMMTFQRDTGNIGIGTTAPFDILEASKAGAGTIGGVIVASNSSAAGAGNEADFGFRANSNFASTGYYSGRISSITPAADNLSDMAFFTYNGTTASGVERMRILSGGNVGIGTTAPGQNLTVSGTGVNYNPTLGLYAATGSGNADARNWGLQSNFNVYGDFGITQSNAKDGNPTSAGTARLYIDATGEVGINTTSPGVLLQIKATNSTLPALGTAGGSLAVLGTTDLFGLYVGTDNFTGGSWLQAMRNDSATSYPLFLQPLGGDVGIGTTAPGAKLDVRDGRFILTDTDVAQPATAYEVTNAFSRFSPLSGTAGGLDIWGFSDTNAQAMRFLAVMGSADPTDTTPAIGFRADKSDGGTGSQALGASETAYQFANYTSPIMTMLGSGNVGVGVVAPTSKLHIDDTNKTNSSNAANVLIRTTDATAIDVGGVIALGGNFASGAGWAPFGSIRGAKENATLDNYAGYLQFNTIPTGDVFRERMRITSAGNVGIGTVSPVYKLVVSNSSAEGFEFIPGFASGIDLLQTYNRTASTYDSLRMDTADYRFTIGGAEKVRIDTTGNVGIGTTNPAAKLTVSADSEIARFIGANAAGAYQQFMDVSTARGFIGYGDTLFTSGGNSVFGLRSSSDLTFATNGAYRRMTIDTTGNVGIGTTTPDRKLVVSGGISGSNTGIFAIQQTGGSAANSGASIEFSGVNGSSVITDMAKIGTLLQNGTNGSESSDLAFSTKGSGTLAERMRITAAGSVGIGTTSPVGIANRTNLRISGGAYGGALVIDSETAEADIFRMWFASGATPVFNIGNETANDLAFSTNNTERMRITNAGYVGIGTTTPLEPLHVTGGPGITAGWVRSAVLEAIYPILGFNSTAAGKHAGIGYDSTGGFAFWVDASTNDIPGTGIPVLSLFNSGTAYFPYKMGIGTSTPTHLLDVGTSNTHVYAGAGPNSYPTIGTSYGAGAYMELYNGGTGATTIFNTSYPIIFAPGGTAKMNVLANGNVGVGTTTPEALLHLKGSTGEIFQVTNSSNNTAFALDNATLNARFYGLAGINSPRVTSVSDTDTGLAWGVADTVGLSTGGVSRLTISGADVGIGTTTPSSKLHLVGTSGSTAPIFNVASSSLTSFFNVLSNGNVGIATSTPVSGLTLGAGKSILAHENRVATSTSMTVDFTAGNTQNIQMGTGATTIGFSNANYGATVKLIICNPANAAGGAITWTGVTWSGGTVPTQTTTAQKCDVFSFLSTSATGTARIFGSASTNF